MYKNILVTLDQTATDATIIQHIIELARRMDSRVVLLHVATGPVAKWRREDAGSQEIEQSRVYLELQRKLFEEANVPAEAVLAYGDAVQEIVKWTKENPCDLVAMSTHGHLGVADFVLGATAFKVQHSISIPMLLLRAR
jgi:nucleotide-binding universal stress UspA family protein